MKAHQSHSSCFYPIFLLPSLPETKVPNACHSSVLLWSWEQGQHPQHTTISTESHGLNSRSGTAQPALTSVATQGSQAKREKLGGSGGFQDEGEQREQIKWKKAGDPPPKKMIGRVRTEPGNPHHPGILLQWELKLEQK